jgi:hypothetical protein
MTASAQFKAQQAKIAARASTRMAICVTVEELHAVIAGLGLESARLIKFLHGSHGRRMQDEGRRNVYLRQGLCDDLRARLQDLERRGRGSAAARDHRVGGAFGEWRVGVARERAKADAGEGQSP